MFLILSRYTTNLLMVVGSPRHCLDSSHHSSHHHAVL